MDSSQRLLTGAKVELRSPGSFDSFNFVMTDSEGNFIIPGVRSGTYDLVVSFDTAQEHEHISVSPGNSRFDVQLPVRRNDLTNSEGTISVSQLKIPDAARKEFQKAQQAFIRNRLTEARERVDATIAAYPNFPAALTMRGVLKFSGKEIESGLDDLQSAIKIDPNYALAYIAMGSAYNTINRFDDAIRVLNYGIALNPALWNAYYELSKAKLGIANYAEALTDADRAADLNNEYPPLYLVKAHAFMGMKQYENAIANLELFLARSPSGENADNAHAALEEAKTALAKAAPQTATPTAGARPETHE